MTKTTTAFLFLFCILHSALCIASAQADDAGRVLERLDGYLQKYEGELSTVVADEELIQETDGRLMRKQTQWLHSEMAFIRLPGDREWLGFRSVRIVNGKPLTGVKPLADLLASTSADTLQQTSLLVNESAKYNLGNPRTINMPNLPLELLSRKYRHRYQVSRHGRSRARDRAVEEIELSEIGETPIIYNEGPRMHSTVRAWIDAETGTLWRAEVTLKAPGDRRNPTWLRIDFARDAVLNVVVPVTMRERFNWVADTGTSVATYTNFRRFQTSARIVPQP